LVADDPDAAWAGIAEHVLYQRSNYARWFAAAGTPIFGEVPASADELRQRSPDIVVTPARARELVAGVVERLPVSHVYWWAIPPGVAPKTTYHSIELFAREVLAG
jgi:hypothetical protein